MREIVDKAEYGAVRSRWILLYPQALQGKQETHRHGTTQDVNFVTVLDPMCWSLPVSVFFFTVETYLSPARNSLPLVFSSRRSILTLIFLFKRDATRRDRFWGLLFGLVAGIEFLEAFLWHYVNAEQAAGTTCSLGNRVVTSIIYYDIFMQPVGFNLFLIFASEKKERPKFHATLLLSGVTTVFMYIMFAYQALIVDNGVWRSCSHVGPNGHLAWKWINYANYVLPNGYPYFSLMFFPLFFVKPWPTRITTLAVFAGGVLFNQLAFDQTEFCSTWCWFSILFLVGFILDPFMTEYHWPRSMSQFIDPKKYAARRKNTAEKKADIIGQDTTEYTDSLIHEV